MSGASRFHVVSVGWDVGLIESMLDPIEAKTAILFSHIGISDRDTAGTRRADRPRLHCLPPASRVTLPPADRALLGSLERADVPTVHNMIMSDRLARHLPYDEALAYATYLARGLDDLLAKLQPSIVLGGFDSMHSGVALAVARKRGIPWFAMSFSTIPRGLTCFCTGLTPDTCITVQPSSDDALRALAERTLDEFERKAVTVPAYVSANSIALILRRLPLHVRALTGAAGRVLTGQFDRFTDYGVQQLARDYIRKRVNLYRLPTGWFCDTPPAAPFVLFGLHMQPESSIDVWAPFHANQFGVIESLARSVPPTHQLLVKLHKSDADNYSRSQLDFLRRLPGVRLVSPFASSRAFVEAASMIVAIQGTMALEAALLGKPVIVFGDSMLPDLPSVAKVEAIRDLPDLIRRKLGEERPSRDAIVQGLMAYLSYYARGCYNDWEATLSPGEVSDLAKLFRSLREYVVARARGG
jgi:hypothetical protein